MKSERKNKLVRISGRPSFLATIVNCHPERNEGLAAKAERNLPRKDA